MDNFLKNNNDVLTLLLDEVLFDEDIMLGYLESRKQKSTDEIYQNRVNDGVFEVLINRSLKNTSCTSISSSEDKNINCDIVSH